MRMQSLTSILKSETCQRILVCTIVLCIPLLQNQYQIQEGGLWGGFEAASSAMVSATHAGHWNSGVARTLLTHLLGFVVGWVVAYNLI